MNGAQLRWLFFSLRGRVGPAAYVLAGLLLYLAIGFTFYRLYQLVMIDPEAPAAQTWSIIFLLAVIVGNWSLFALTVKRFHDFGWSGLWALTSLVAGFFLLLILPFMRSDPGPNAYGSAPNLPA